MLWAAFAMGFTTGVSVGWYGRQAVTAALVMTEPLGQVPGMMSDTLRVAVDQVHAGFGAAVDGLQQTVQGVLPR